MIGCKGGWCKSRNNCAHYSQATRREDDPDRLCGREEEPEMLTVIPVRAVGEWERKGAGLMAQAGPFDGLLAEAGL